MLPGYWCDIGNLEQYRYAHYDILIKINIKLPAAEEEPGIWIADEVYINADAQLIPPFYIGKGTYIGSKAVVGDYSVLGAYNHLMEKVSIKGESRGRRFPWKTSPSEGNFSRGCASESAASVYEGVVIGESSIVESKATLRPGVRVWPCKRVESGALVNSNLIWGINSGVRCLELTGFGER